MARITWAVAAPLRLQRFSQFQKMSKPLKRTLLQDCLYGGAQPHEAYLWRSLFPPHECHPLPILAALRLLGRLGSQAEHRLLSDKQKTSELLAAAGIPVPDLQMEILPNSPITLDTAPWTSQVPLFVKPRHGSGGRGGFSITPLPSTLWSIDGSCPKEQNTLLALLKASARNDSLLVQTQLNSPPELIDLESGGIAPVLRLTTARRPGKAPFLHSSLLSIAVPEKRRTHFLAGQMRVPIRIADGRMTNGIWFLRPDERHASLPWNGSPLTDRPLPNFSSATALTLQAMALFPNLPLVNWDVILTPQGPVIIEGNSCGDWILTNLSGALGMECEPLFPLLRQWLTD